MPEAEKDHLSLSLSHYSKINVLAPRSVAQDNGRADKPRGLWVSVDGEDDWPSWATAEEWDIGEHRFVVTLAEEANLLLITSPDELLSFDAEFGIDGSHGWRVDWQAVASQWQGIIVAPYLWSCRLGDPSWYYTWDCASGCIWDASAIASVTAPELVFSPAHPQASCDCETCAAGDDQWCCRRCHDLAREA